MYKYFVKPFLDRLDHETAQHTTINLLHNIESNPFTLQLLETIGTYKGKRYTHPKLTTVVAGITFDNPVLLAAGWDRDGKAVRAMYQLGFGGVEIGTVTAYPQPGNTRPRLHLLDKDVALNHFGFSGPGMEVVARNLERYKNSGIPIGISVTKNKYVNAVGAAPFYAVVVRRLYEQGDYFVLNVSSPNTVGLKVLQQKKYLSGIVKEVNNMMEDIGDRKPVFIKIAPDIPYKTLDDVLDVITENKLAGIIAVNTFPHANTIAKYGVGWEDRQGGLSGNDKHYRSIGTKYIAYIHKKSEGKIPIIGVGGVHDATTALEKIAAGASLVQTFTGLTAVGPNLPGKINRDVVEYLNREGVKHISDLVGIDSKKILDNPSLSYSFSIITKNYDMPNLKKEYLSAVFQNNSLDTLLIGEKPFKLKHGELGRNWSKIYLNHRIPLFKDIEYRKLFVRILISLIKERLLTGYNKDFGLISVASSSSPELTNDLQKSSNTIDRLVVTPKAIMQSEKGAHQSVYGNFDKNKPWVIIDDVFTSGKTMKESISLLKENKSLPSKISSVSIVARNNETINIYENQTGISMTPFITLDELLSYHWKDFTSTQKRSIQQEREALQ